MNVYECIALTGGAANALDAISWSVAADGDMAFVTASQRFYVFRYDGSSSDAEDVSDHPYTIKPDDAGAENGRWLEATSAIIESDFDHDSLSGYEANEHIDWTDASANFATTGSTTITNSADSNPVDVVCNKAGDQYIRTTHEQNQSTGYIIRRNESGGSYNVAWYIYIADSLTRLQLYSDGGAGIAMHLSDDTGDLWVKGDLEANSYSDHTPMFAGKAVDLIKSIAAKPGTVSANLWGELDHDTLPAGVLAVKIELDEDEKPVTIKSRNLSNMVSLLTRGIQELIGRIEALEEK